MRVFELRDFFKSAQKSAQLPKKHAEVIDTSEEKGCISMANIREKRPHSMTLYGRKQRNILLYDVCFHIQSRTDPMEGLRFFSWCRSWLTSSPAACWYSAQRTGRACRRSLRPAASLNAINPSRDGACRNARHRRIWQIDVSSVP